MKMIHYALVGGLVMFGAVVLVITKGRMTLELAFGNPMLLVAAVAAMGSIALACALKGIVVKSGGNPAVPGAALQKYQVFVLMRAAVIEGGALFSAVATLISLNVLPACLFAVCAVVLIFFRPTEREFIDVFGPGRS